MEQIAVVTSRVTARIAGPPPPGKFHHGSVTDGEARRLRRDRGQVARLRKAIGRVGGCTPAFLAILTILAGHLGADGTCNPTLATLAAESGYCVRTVQRALEWVPASLIDWDNRKRRVDRDWFQTSNQYVIWPLEKEPHEAPAVAGLPLVQPSAFATVQVNLKSDSFMDSRSPLERALASLGRAVAAREAKRG